MKPHIVIIGGGFGGVYTAKHLEKYAKKRGIKITLINDEEYFLFTPLVHEVATGGLSAGSVTESLDRIFRGGHIEVCVGEVEHIDPLGKMVSLGEREISYDYLVIASGAKNNFYDIPGAHKHTIPLKTLYDAKRIKTEIQKYFLSAKLSAGKTPHIAVIGGGPTGVELAGELVDFCNRLRRVHVPQVEESTRITLVDKHARVLYMLDPAIQDRAHRRLERLGIETIMGKTVQEIRAGQVVFDDDATLSADILIWTAGVKPCAPKIHGYEKEKILVNGNLQSIDFEHIYAIGDVAEMPEKLPLLAQVAVAQSRTVARNIMAHIQNTEQKAFSYQSKGVLVSIGQWFAVGKIFSIITSGWFIWWIWRTVYLFKFISNRKKLRIASEWTINLFRPRNIN